MATPIDPVTLRAALMQVRRQRAQIRQANPTCPDSVHVILRPGDTSVLDVVTLRFPDSPYDGPPGRPRYRDMGELKRWLEALAREPPTPPGTLRDEPYSLVSMWFVHTVHGAGAEIAVEARVSDAGPLRWTLYRVAADGAPTEVGDDLDDALFERTFGRPLTLAASWRRVLEQARSGAGTVHEVETGYVIFAGRADDAAFTQRIAEFDASDAGYRVVRLGTSRGDALVALEPGIAQWAPEAARDVASGVIVAGGAVRTERARDQLLLTLEHRGIEWQQDARSSEIFAASGEALWPLDPPLLAAASVHLAQTLTETAASFASVIGTRLATIEDFLSAARKARAGFTFTVQRSTARVTRPDGGDGPPIDLSSVPFRAPVGSREFERDLRFACDVLPAGADPTRTCLCGAPAKLFPRLAPSSQDPATGGRPSGLLLAQWPRDRALANVVLVAECEVHDRVLTPDEVARAGFVPSALDMRLAEVVPATTFRLTVSAQADARGRVALLAFGSRAASIGLHPQWASGLHHACGRPIAGRTAVAVAILPDAVCLHDEAIDPALIRAIVARLAAASPGGAPVAFAWPADLSLAPLGLFQIAPAGGPLMLQPFTWSEPKVLSYH